MPRTNTLIASNSSGVPGLRLAVRRGHQVVDVTWNERDGRRCCTSYLVATAGPLQAVERAMKRRQRATRCRYDITPRQAWERLKRGVR